MSKVVMKCLGLAGPRPKGLKPSDLPTGQYLKAYDQEKGISDWTNKIHEAMTFDSLMEAVELWQSVLPSQPVRADGKPNKPLTAFNVTFDEVEG